MLLLRAKVSEFTHILTHKMVKINKLTDYFVNRWDNQLLTTMKNGLYG